MANVDRYRWRPGCFVGQAIEPTVEGVLGGFGSVSPADLRESDAFITKVIPHVTGSRSCRDAWRLLQTCEVLGRTLDPETSTVIGEQRAVLRFR